MKLFNEKNETTEKFQSCIQFDLRRHGLLDQLAILHTNIVYIMQATTAATTTSGHARTQATAQLAIQAEQAIEHSLYDVMKICQAVRACVVDDHEAEHDEHDAS
jgi:hypothetical protein